jgi:hypothetical protein
MTKLAVFDAEGLPAAFYSRDVHGDSVPAEAVEITDEQWQEFLDHQGLRRWLDGEVVTYDPPPPAPTVDDIIAERERRLALGFDYDFGEGDPRGVHHIGTTAQDMAGWREVTDLANALIAAGETTPILIVTDTGPAEVTPAEWSAILITAGAARQPIWAASFVLQSMDPIPANYAENSYWAGS